MKTYKIVTAVFALASLLLIGCNEPAEINNQQTTNDSLTLKIDSMDFNKMKADLKEKYETAIAKMDKEIDVLEAKIEKTEEKGKAEIEKSIDELKKERKALNDKMQEIEKTAESTWAEWKGKAEDLLDKTEKKADSVKQSIKDTVAAW